MPLSFRRSRAWHGAVVAALLLVASPASADSLTLRDGTKLEGKITIQKPGEYVIIVLANGSQKTVMWENIKEVEVAPAAPAPESPASPEPPVTTPSPSPSPSPSPNPTPPPTTSSGSPFELGPLTGKPPSDRPPSAPPSRELGISQVPKHGAAQLVLAVPFHYGFAERLDLAGAGIGLGLRLQVGAAFPTQGKRANWSGFYVEGLATISYHTTKLDLSGACSTCLGEKPESKDASLQTGGHAGYQFFHLGDAETNERGDKQQSGYGFSVGLYGGRFSSLGNLASSAMFGPVIGVSKNEYDPLRRTFNSLHVDLMVLPMSTFTLMSLAVTGGFG